MNQEQFLLKWNNHQNNFVEVFTYLRNQDAFVDVTLACDGKSFSAHKVVLSACSPYFQMLFQRNPCKHPIVFLKDVKGQDLEALIEFIYKGEVSVSQTELASLISTAENLKIKGLAEPDRPLDKSAKKIAAHATGCQNGILSGQPGPAISLGNSLQSQSSVPPFTQCSPPPKRKRTDTFVHQAIFCNREKDDKTVVDSRDSHPVVLIPPHETLTSPDTSAQSYSSHHSALTATEGVLYSVSGAAIYVAASQPSSTNRDLGREVYATNVETYTSGEEVTIPGPSGVHHGTQHSEDIMHPIKIESTSTTENWEESNHSYEDSGGEEKGEGSEKVCSSTASLASTADVVGVSIPIHTELTEGTLHDSPREQVAAATAFLRALAASGTNNVNSVRLHDGFKQFGVGVCKVCGERIPRGEHRSHMASHTSNRPLHCAICGRGFHQTEDLKRHIRVHTGEKPYKCASCGVAFRQKGHLSRHVLKYHPEIRTK